ncbi:MSMEG_6728 family protein [Streptomyces sp. MBT97]|nr:MSMEG_6728 family protein [Streptomyces sp. MBT97]
MWTGYEEALVRYGLEICGVWTATGRADTCAASLTAGFTGQAAGVRTQERLAEAGELPPWLGDPAFHRSHRSALLRKDPEFYTALFPGVPDDLPYVWPPSDRDTPATGPSTRRTD